MSKHDICGCGREKDSRSKRCSICANVGFLVNRNIDEYENRLLECIRTSNSFLSAAKKANVSRLTITKVAKKYGVDLSHMRRGRGRPYEDKDIFCLVTAPMSAVVKNRFLQLFPEKNLCAKCGLHSLWQGKELCLQLHHKDGNSLNNVIENLEMLCPNCHSQTPTYVGNNTKKERGNA